MPVADLKIGPLSKIVADRPVNGGSEIPASRVQAAQKKFFSKFHFENIDIARSKSYRSRISIYRTRSNDEKKNDREISLTTTRSQDQRKRGYPVTTWGVSWPDQRAEILGSSSLASQRSSELTFPGLKGGGKHRTLDSPLSPSATSSND